jgi:CO/xanthine dehydrogenase Mo-binding subunit
MTVEGLSATKLGAALQHAFVANGAAQCGICTPGMLMAAFDTLQRFPLPTRQQVLDGLGGVLCRCTGYQKIVDAVLMASCETAPLTVPAVGHAVGARVARWDAVEKVNGQCAYGADAWPDGILHMKVFRSPYASALVETGDLQAWVSNIPGMAGVITHRDININRFAIFPDLRDQPALAEDRVRLQGEAVFAVVGSDQAIAGFSFEDDPPPVTLTPTSAALTIEQALDAPPVHERWPENVLCKGLVDRGDVVTAIAQASIVVRAQMQTQHVEHAAIEPEAGWAHWHEPPLTQGGQQVIVTVVVTTQTPYMDRDELAHMFALDPAQVRIIPSAVGGGFGGKLDMSVQPLIVAASRKFGQPVGLVLDRTESMLSTTKRHPAQMQATLAMDHTNTLLAYRFHGDFNTGPYSSWGPTVANRVPIHASGPYRFAHVRASTRAVISNNAIAGAFRGFGVPQSTLLNERLMDEAAIAAGQDPLRFRHKHALRAGDTTPTGQNLAASVGLQACLEAVEPEWLRLRADCEAFNLRAPAHPHHEQRFLRRGVGIACMWYGIGNTVIANPSRMRVGINAEGQVTLYNGAVDIGQGTMTVMAQMAADACGISMEHLRQVHADTALTLDAGKSSASRQTFVSGNAARLAGLDLRRQILKAAGVDDEHAQIEWPTPNDAKPASIAVLSAGRPPVKLVLPELPPLQGGDVLIGEGSFNPPTIPLDENGQGVPYATYGFAAQFAVVEVDVALGQVRVLEIHAAHDVGKAINPTQVEGQIHGGIAQGLGLALMEDYVAGRTDNLHDYLIPTVGDMPHIVTHVIEDPEPLGPWGAKGVGEPALCATAPAILNAIHHACGVRMEHTPVTPARLLQALQQGKR